MKHLVTLYIAMLVFTAIALCLKNPTAKFVLLAVTWADYIALNWLILTTKDSNE